MRNPGSFAVIAGLVGLILPASALPSGPGFDPVFVPARGPECGVALPLAVLDGPDASNLPSTIAVKKTDGSIVTLDLEDYLKGVLPKEIGTSFPVEAMKAQAVAARSYAVWYAWSKGSICTTSACQVWAEQHYAATDAAVEATRGQVMAWQGKVVPFFFSASCGGHTVSNAEVWSGQPLPWLTPAPCIENKVGKCEVVCTPDQPKSSTCWGVNGHRVGLCQRGAQAMAACGSSYIDILLHYAGGGTLIGPEGPVSPPDAEVAGEEIVADPVPEDVEPDIVEPPPDEPEAGETASGDATDVKDAAIPVPDVADAGGHSRTPLPYGSSCVSSRFPATDSLSLLALALTLFLALLLSRKYRRQESQNTSNT